MTVLNQPLQASRAGIIIACMNQKGGVGKTTTAVNLCGEFARHNLKVLSIVMPKVMQPQVSVFQSEILNTPHMK